ncbi:MAG: BON domain-containing protein [Proteobacteria bacterium]|nr:BON domain-containing protein [Pseudomonadota bacterium]
MKRTALVLALALVLPGCVAFVAGAATGGMVVYEKRNVQTISDDTQIRHQVALKIKADLDFKDSHIAVASFNRVVLLVGEVPQASLREQAEKLARQVPKIKAIYNEIKVKHPISALSEANDSWITTKIKTQMLATNDLKSGLIKVVTEDANVYLMGKVTHHQADIAVDIARQVSGVQRVVKVFEYEK